MFQFLYGGCPFDWSAEGEWLKFDWSQGCQQAFENVKMLLGTVPVLSAPRLDRPFQLQVDASHVGTGAVLLQADDLGMDRPVSFFSKKCISHQLNYSTIDKKRLWLWSGLFSTLMSMWRGGQPSGGLLRS